MVKCPLVNREIEEGECVVTVDVCECMIKETVLSNEITEQKNWREICKKCEYHES